MDIEAQLAELGRTVGYLKDRADILDCIQRESRARDRQDVDMISGCWWPEGVDEHGAVIATADVYPEQANAGHQGGFIQTSHNITNQIIHAIDASSASVESYVVGGAALAQGRSQSRQGQSGNRSLPRPDGKARWRMAHPDTALHH